MAQNHIQKMMANLDAEVISTVNDCLPELTEHVIVAEQGTTIYLSNKYHKYLVTRKTFLVSEFKLKIKFVLEENSYLLGNHWILW